MASPSGHLNSLTPSQEAKLLEFWALVLTSATCLLASTYHCASPDPLALFSAINSIPEPKPTIETITAALDDFFQNQTKNQTLTQNHTHSQSHNDNHNNAPTTNPAPDPDPDPDPIPTPIPNPDLSPLPSLPRTSMQRLLSHLSPSQISSCVLAMIKQEHPDRLVLRFLRARKWDVEKAFAMLVAAVQWRGEIALDEDLLARGEAAALEEEKKRNNTHSFVNTNTSNGTNTGKSKSKSKSKSKNNNRKSGGWIENEFLAQLRMGKSFLRGVDRAGRPVTYVRVRLHRPGRQSQATLERYIVHVIEMTRMVVGGRVETGVTIVFDMTGFSISNMEQPPLKFIIRCFEANYPESLGLLLIHNAPWIFLGIWKLVHSWMDPVVASKVHFTRSVTELEQFIAREQIPVEMGGDDDWVYEYVEPEEGENEKMGDEETRERLLGERRGIGGRVLGVTAEMMLSHKNQGEGEDRERVTAKREGVIEELRVNYWQLDPYVRARTMIDRTGDIQMYNNGQMQRSSNSVVAQVEP